MATKRKAYQHVVDSLHADTQPVFLARHQTKKRFQGFFGWRDMPTQLRDRIAADVRAVAAEMPSQRLEALGQVVRVGTTADFLAMIEDQRNRVRTVVKSGMTGLR